MKLNEIREFTDTELVERLVVERDRLTQLKMSHVITPLDNPLLIRDVRRTIARFETELRKRELNK